MTLPRIAILGATGAQGGGLVRALLADPQRRFEPVALTRKPLAPAATALAAQGVAVHSADLDDEATLARAFEGVHGVFAVTNFWEHFSPAKELAQAGNIARAARRADVKHLVWSTLEDTRKDVPLHDPRMPTLMEHYKVPHLDAKGEANALFRAAGVPTTFMHTSYYWENLFRFGMTPQRLADGELVFTLPMDSARLPGIAAADIGACAAGLFALGQSVIGREIGLAGEHLSGAEMAQALAHALGEPVRHNAMAPADYAKLGFPGADDLANMFQYERDFNTSFCALRSVEATRAVHPGLLDFAGWLAQHRDKLRAAAAQAAQVA